MKAPGSDLNQHPYKAFYLHCSCCVLVSCVAQERIFKKSLIFQTSSQIFSIEVDACNPKSIKQLLCYNNLNDFLYFNYTFDELIKKYNCFHLSVQLTKADEVQVLTSNAENIHEGNHPSLSICMGFGILQFKTKIGSSVPFHYLLRRYDNEELTRNITAK
ncbi:hypothetical protein Cgig2_012837 [Carnegiea gigantea]|uniref:Uncharacterized protein n=1 Tax=Carnegiea gigantea TaxID=171969 RepID=A0A9Q1QEA4_9CARY|nr:hypothetical protein Cgig2_012837 [Carnegiea gigantea]